jgi:hypothetical protein
MFLTWNSHTGQTGICLLQLRKANRWDRPGLLSTLWNSVLFPAFGRGAVPDGSVDADRINSDPAYCKRIYAPAIAGSRLASVSTMRCL